MKTFLCVLLCIAGCSAQKFPILTPPDDAPAWAQKQCGSYPIMCSDGGCCSRGFECTSDTFPPMYAYPGYCRWLGTNVSPYWTLEQYK